MQAGYIYFLTEPLGEGFRADFTPVLSPKQMLALGVFGGKYMTDCRDEFPAAWYAEAKAKGVDGAAVMAEFRAEIKKLSGK
jgi:hypothetical protein